jgi:hypothetical protein
MHRIRSLATRGAVALLVSATVLALGCGDGTGLDKRYRVSGTVKYKGEPVKQGSITFNPTDLEKGRTATGSIVDGSYTLTTAIEGDGALPGDYRVAISATEVDLTSAAANVSGGGSMRQDDVAKANRDSKKLIPTKYAIPDTSGLTKTVEPRSNTFDFDLTD